MYFNNDTFYSDYGFWLKQEFPNIQFEVVSSEEAIKKNDKQLLFEIIDKEKPDMISIDHSIFEVLIQRGMLLDLEPLILRDKYNIEQFVQPVIEYLRHDGKGKLFGLTPIFNSRALFYNKTLFDRYQIPYPSERMTWLDVFDTAKRFPNSEVFGFEYRLSDFNPMILVNEILLTHGLSYWGPNSQKLVQSNSDFEAIMDLVINAYQEGYIYSSEHQDNETVHVAADAPSEGMFLSGRAAMTYGNYYFLNDIEAASFNKRASFDWSIVPEPVDRDHIDYTYNYVLYDVFAVHSTTRNQDVAWEILKYIHSEQSAKNISLSANSGGLSTLRNFVTDKWGKSLSAFHQLHPRLDGEVKIPFNNDLAETAKRATLDRMRGTITSKEAWNQISAAVEEQYVKRYKEAP
ncbi:ABC transporter substrate-binding protein [Paenibacillus sp. GYB003]|uniref:ABC transporter substrate-binding protein n=1 Tax=Paenibacillus sp. GYB003 TaxID=2994392 RepID=UPI002F965B7C